MSVQTTEPCKVVGKVFRGHTPKAQHPLAQPAMIGVDMLHMVGSIALALDAPPTGHVDGLVADARFPCKDVIAWVAVAHQQAVSVQVWAQMLVQQRPADTADARDGIQRLRRAVAGNEHAHRAALPPPRLRAGRSKPFCPLLE